MRTHGVAALACLLCLAVATGCASTRMKDTAFALSASEWTGKKKVEAHLHTTGILVMTKQRDWGATFLNQLLAGGLVGLAINPPDFKDDSTTVSRQLDNGLGQWQFDDFCKPLVCESLQTKACVPVKVLTFQEQMARTQARMDWDIPKLARKLQDMRDQGVDPQEITDIMVTRAARRMEQPDTLLISVTLTGMLHGEGRPELQLTLNWQPEATPSQPGTAMPPEMAPPSGVMSHQQVMAHAEEMTRNLRTYHFYSGGHSRDEWTADGCALFKEEVRRGIRELAGKMAADLFAAAPRSP